MPAYRYHPAVLANCIGQVDSNMKHARLERGRVELLKLELRLPPS